MLKRLSSSKFILFEILYKKMSQLCFLERNNEELYVKLPNNLAYLSI